MLYIECFLCGNQVFADQVNIFKFTAIVGALKCYILGKQFLSLANICRPNKVKKMFQVLLPGQFLA